MKVIAVLRKSNSLVYWGKYMNEVVIHQEYQNRVMKLEQVNHIFYNHVMSDPVKAKEYHDIDSLVNTQPVLKKLWKME